MGQFINLLNAKVKYYDGPVRALDPTFGKDYFDGSRNTGFGGYRYIPGWWDATIDSLTAHYDIKDGISLLDLGCAKGFFLADFRKRFPNSHLHGIDISAYAIDNADPSVKDCVHIGDCSDLSGFEDNSFDLVTGMNVIHFLPPDQAEKALSEIQRISKGHSFVQVDSFHNELEKERMLAWAPTIKTLCSPTGWREMFQRAGYLGDYWWTIMKQTAE